MHLLSSKKQRGEKNMEKREFSALYKRLIEYNGLPPPRAAEILRKILLRLQEDKEKKK